MRRLIAAAAASVLWLLASAPVVHAQPQSAVVVSACGTPGNTPVVGNYYPMTQDVQLRACGLTVGPSGLSANQVQGTSASGATDDGSNPVKIGGVYSATLTALITGQRGNVQLTANGSMRSFMTGVGSATKTGLSSTSVFATQDNQAAVAASIGVSQFLYNQTNQDAAVSINGSVAAGTGDTAIADAPHTVALFTPVVCSGCSTLQGKASAGNQYVIYLVNTDTVTHYLWAINTTTTPTNAAYSTGIATGNLQNCVTVAAGQTGSLGGLDIPEPYTVGIYFANSTTGCGAASNTLALSTVGFMHGLVK